MIPVELGDLINLDRLVLGPNRLGGHVPEQLSNLINLQYLAIDHNLLTGTVPEWLGGLSALKYLMLNSNSFTGALPPTLTSLSLNRFFYDKTDLCEPDDQEYQTWLSSIPYLQRTNVICGTQTISGIVWDDLNRDGVQGTDEPPLAGLTVTLTANAGSLLSVAAGRQVVTDDAGRYRFGFVAPGAYNIAVAGPGGYLPTVPGPVTVVVPAEGDVSVPPIGLAWAPAHV